MASRQPPGPTSPIRTNVDMAMNNLMSSPTSTSAYPLPLPPPPPPPPLPLPQPLPPQQHSPRSLPSPHLTAHVHQYSPPPQQKLHGPSYTPADASPTLPSIGLFQQRSSSGSYSHQSPPLQCQSPGSGLDNRLPSHSPLPAVEQFQQHHSPTHRQGYPLPPPSVDSVQQQQPFPVARLPIPTRPTSSLSGPLPSPIQMTYNPQHQQSPPQGYQYQPSHQQPTLPGYPPTQTQQSPYVSQPTILQPTFQHPLPQHPHSPTLAKPTTAPRPASNPRPAQSVPKQPSPTPVPANQIPPGGAPARKYLNEKVTPALLEGMKMLVREQPDDPLLALAKFLEERHREMLDDVKMEDVHGSN
ncbi:hypothetical protein EDC01DRAFT_703998 [Geopyxis carbonaria]|nr:hypothetical protein EDC01DRAFT_703998 [Geopyxis carbonaria]